MTSENSHPSTLRWRRRFLIVVVVWFGTTVLMSIPAIRGWVSLPLYVHDPDAQGDVAYVMADGPAYWERLIAASDLYHMDQVKKILILDETRSGGYNFIKNRSQPMAERATEYLVWRGVPINVIETVSINTTSSLGSLSEGRGVAAQFTDIKSLVVVTSAQHTRRSLLCFQRSLPGRVELSVYSASEPHEGAELYSPIWLEYLKLAIYYVAA